MKQNIIEKMKSPVLWSSLLALIYFVTKEWFHFDIPAWSQFVEIFLAVLMAFGITNNPNSRNTF